MPSVSRLYLDTNILVRAFEGDDELHDLLDEMLYAPGERSEPFFVTSEITFAEALVRPLREQNEERVSLYERWSISNFVLDVRPASIDRGILYNAAVLRAKHKGLKLPDAIHISTAIGAGCSHVLTFDLRIAGSYSADHIRSDVLLHYPRFTGKVDVLEATPDAIRQIIEAASA